MASSRGAGTSKSQDAVLRLHRLHFIEKRGMDGVHELIAERGKHVKNDITQTETAHRDRVKGIKTTMEHELKRSLVHGGSLTVRTKEERERIEELRQDPVEAHDKMVKHMRELGRSYKEQTTAMTKKVSAKAAMNVRTKEELDRWEELRQDSHEAKAKMEKHMREKAQIAKEEKAAIKEKVNAMPKNTFRSKEERDRIEELRQDPDEALEKMTKHMHDRTQNWKREKTAITDRVNAIPAMSFRTKDNLDQIEELRQDPDEAREKMTQHMKELARIDKEEKAMMKERLRASPRKTFWTKEQINQIEELRQDPVEAKEKMTKHMQELARSYKDKMNNMAEKMRALPKKTFRTPEERGQRETVDELRLTRLKSFGK